MQFLAPHFHMGGTETLREEEKKKKALMPSFQTSAESGKNWVQGDGGMEGGQDK